MSIIITRPSTGGGCKHPDGCWLTARFQIGQGIGHMERRSNRWHPVAGARRSAGEQHQHADPAHECGAEPFRSRRDDRLRHP